jgi:hypothetical protein
LAWKNGALSLVIYGTMISRSPTVPGDRKSLEVSIVRLKIHNWGFIFKFKPVGYAPLRMNGIMSSWLLVQTIATAYFHASGHVASSESEAAAVQQDPILLLDQQVCFWLEGVGSHVHHDTADRIKQLWRESSKAVVEPATLPLRTNLALLFHFTEV